MRFPDHLEFFDVFSANLVVAYDAFIEDAIDRWPTSTATYLDYATSEGVSIADLARRRGEPFLRVHRRIYRMKERFIKS